MVEAVAADVCAETDRQDGRAPEHRQIPLLPKQLEFVEARERELIYSGAFGAGKTRALCWKAVQRASIPGACEILCRKHNVTLRRTTLRTLLEPDGDLPPVLTPGYYVHNKSLQTISLRGGGTIVYFGLDDPDKVGSTPATGCGVDEAVELEEADWTALRGRIRVKVKGLSNQLYGACNPGGPAHHLAKRFGLSGEGKAAKGCRAIITKTEDNWLLPQDYVEDLRTYQGVALQRYFYGRWVAAEGLVFPALLDAFVPHRPAPSGAMAGGIDFGFRNPFCALLGTIYRADNGRDVLYVWWGRYLRECPLEVHAQAMAEAEGDYGAEWFSDPEDPEARRDLRKAGLSVRKAVNRQLYGIDAVNGLLAGDQLFVSDALSDLRAEAEVYCYPDPEKEKLPAKFDHAMTALRYLCATAKKRGLIRYRVQVDRDKREEEEEDADAA